MILYGKIVDEPRYDQIEETNETYFYITVEDLKQNKQKVALSYNVSNDHALYQKGTTTTAPTGAQGTAALMIWAMPVMPAKAMPLGT